jgi:hypothetical protein
MHGNHLKDESMAYIDIKSEKPACGWTNENEDTVVPVDWHSGDEEVFYELSGQFTESDLRGLLLAMARRYDRDAYDCADAARRNEDQWSELTS